MDASQKQELTQLAEATAKSHNKAFANLDAQQQLSILKLNRLALQAAHPNQCPKIPVYTVSNLSILYRHSKLAAWLNLPVADYLLLLDILVMKKSIFNVAEVLDIAAKADWVKTSGFTIPELYYVIKGFGDIGPGKALNKAITEFLKSLRAAHSTRSPDFEVKFKDILWQAFDEKFNERDESVKNAIIDAFIVCVKKDVKESFTEIDFTGQDKSISTLCQKLNENKALTIQVPNSGNGTADKEWLANLNVALEKTIPGLTEGTAANSPLITAMRDRITQLEYKNEKASLTKKLNRLAIELAFPQHAPKTFRFSSGLNAALEDTLSKLSVKATDIPEKLKKEQNISGNQTRKLNRLLLEHWAPMQLAKADIKQLDDEWRKDLVKRLAEFLGGNAEIVDALFDVVARHINPTGYKRAGGRTNYIDEFLYEPSKQLNNGNKEAFASDFIYLLHRWLLLAQKLQLTPTEIRSIKSHENWYESPKTTADKQGTAGSARKTEPSNSNAQQKKEGESERLLVNATALSFERIETLHTFKGLTKAFDDKEDKLIDFLSGLGNQAQQTSFATDLEKITKWRAEETEKLVEKFKIDVAQFPNDGPIKRLAEFNNAFDLAKKLGADIACCLELSNLADKPVGEMDDDAKNWQAYTNAAEAAVNMVKAKCAENEREKIAGKIDGHINELSRTALAGYVLDKFQTEKEGEKKDIKNLRQLSEHLLIDVEMSGCAKVSYLKQAILSVQTYLQRCRMGLEEGVTVNIEESRWKLLMSYREWEASRRVFLYPENYLAAAPRKDRTDLFRTLEDTLLQTNITQEAVENAYKDYLDGLIELANLKISSACRYRIEIEQADGGKQDTLFLFGRTRSEPHAYYYRRCIEPTSLQPSWLPWSKIDIEIKAEEVAPAFAFGKLFLFWVETTKSTETNTKDGDNTEKREIVKAAIKYSYLKVSDKWMQPQTLAKDIDVSAYEKFGSTPVFPFVTPKKDGNPEQIYIVLGSTVSVEVARLYKPIPPVYLLTDNLAVRQDNLFIENNILYMASEEIPSPRCLGYFPMNEGAGQSVNDLISKKTLETQLVKDESAKWKAINDFPLAGFSSALDLDKVVCLTNKAYVLKHNLDRITVEAWVKLEKIDTIGRPSQKIVGCRDNNGKTGFSLAVDENGCLFPEVWTDKGDAISMKEGKVKANEWTHLAFTWNKGDKLIGYINGDKVGEKEETKHTSLELDSKLVIGAIPWDTEKERVYGHGHVAGIRIWDGALSAAQIKACFVGQLPFSLMVKNQPGWYLLGPEDDAFLAIPLDSADSSKVFDINPINEKATLSNGKLSYLSQDIFKKKFRLEKLSADVVRSLVQNALIGGIDPEDDAFLAIPLHSADSSEVFYHDPINEKATLSNGKVSYQHQDISEKKFRLVRLSTGVVRPLAKKALIGGIDHLLTLDSQLTPETDFEKLKLDETKCNPPVNDSLDFYGSYGCYFQEIFFHIPFLVANTLSDHRRFEEARKWYHYVFDPSHPPILQPISLCFWRVTQEGKSLELKNQDDNGSVKIDEKNVVNVADFPGVNHKPVLKFSDGYFVNTQKELPSLSEITISVWIKLTNIESSQKIISNALTYGNKDYSGFIFGIIGKKPHFELHDKQKVKVEVKCEASADIYKDTWTNLVATWRQGGSVAVYVNGKKVAKEEAKGEPLSSDGKIVIGAASWNTGMYQLKADSQIAELRIWDKELSPEQVRLGYNPANRFWRYRPFHNSTLSTLEEMLKDEAAIRAYENDPFDPHAIARLRMGAYEKAVVMKYIDNLIHWGDACFAKDTWESITQASTLYMLAYDLLGSKPAILGQCSTPSAKTYHELSKQKTPEALMSPINNLMATMKFHNTLPSSKSNKSRVPAPVATLFKDAAYFCIPENEQFTGYWKKVEDPLFKIRHCQNIKGVTRDLALFEQRLDPSELVRAATAGSVPLRDATGIPPTAPLHRFEYQLEKAKNIAATVIQLGSSLLGILERKDSEELAALQAGQERALLKLIETTRKKQQEESEANLESLRKNREAVMHREAYYQKLLKDGLSGGEITGTKLRAVASAFELAAANANYLSSPFYFFPNIFGLSNGGHSPGAGLQAIAAGNSSAAGVLNGLAASADIQAQYQRRQQEWEQQLQMAQDDAALIEQQIRAAKINVKIAETELKNHEKSLEQAEQLENFLKSKFATPELYRWMAGRLSLIYFETFKIALEMALSAQAAYQYELDKNDSYIAFDYWDSLKQGLLAGEGLTLCLHQLEKAYIEGNERRFEIEKTISLRKLLNKEEDKKEVKEEEKKFETMKKAGSWIFSLAKEHFDLDFPSHYCRRIKTVAISIPAVVGPYENINATLIQTRNEIQKKRDSSPEPDLRPRQKIALSRGINDSGLFELDFRDVRYLPFEGTGAVSDWELHIPKENNPKLNYDSLTDVIIHLRYTALDGG